MKRISLKGALNLCIIYFLVSILFSCKEPDTVGLNVQPTNDKMNVVHCDTITLVAYSTKEDSIRSDQTYYNLLGCSNDPIFGKNSASFYTQIRLSSDNVYFGVNPVLDSMVLSLVYGSVYGDTTAKQTIKVYELAQNIYQDSMYFSNRDFLTTGVPLATNTFVPDIRDSIKLGKDTVTKYAPQLRIRLNPLLGQKFINESGQTPIADNTDFLNFFKGLYLTATPTSGEGSIINFNLINTQSKVTLYYHNSADTLSYNFVIDAYCQRINHFNHTKYQSANSYLRSEICGDTTKGKNVLYVQSMAGLKVRILYPYLKDLVKKGKIVVNKADLIVDVDDSTDNTFSRYTPPASLQLVEEQSGLIRFLADQYDGTAYFGGTYNSTNREYRFNIARHIQQILDGVEDNLGLYLIVLTSNRPNTPNRVVLKGTKRKTGNIRLQITYTKLY